MHVENSQEINQRIKKRQNGFSYCVVYWRVGLRLDAAFKYETENFSEIDALAPASNFDIWSVYRMNAKLCDGMNVGRAPAAVMFWPWSAHSEWKIYESIARKIPFYFREKWRHRYRKPRNGRREIPQVICYRKRKFMAAIMR